MAWNDEVMHSFEEWWALYGSRIANARNGGTVEPQAFIAGAEWQRERDACVVDDMRERRSNEIVIVALAMCSDAIRKEDASEDF